MLRLRAGFVVAWPPFPQGRIPADLLGQLVDGLLDLVKASPHDAALDDDAQASLSKPLDVIRWNGRGKERGLLVVTLIHSDQFPSAAGLVRSLHGDQPVTSHVDNSLWQVPILSRTASVACATFPKAARLVAVDDPLDLLGDEKSPNLETINLLYDMSKKDHGHHRTSSRNRYRRKSKNEDREVKIMKKEDGNDTSNRNNQTNHYDAK